MPSSILLGTGADKRRREAIRRDNPTWGSSIKLSISMRCRDLEPGLISALDIVYAAHISFMDAFFRYL